MIKNNQTLCGSSIELLGDYSRKKVLRICDRCTEKKECCWQDIYKSRKKHSTNLDYCHPCSMVEYNSGDNNPSKKTNNRKKISEATKGRSKTFKDGKNPRIINAKKNSGGYIKVWLNEKSKYVLEHRNTMENFMNREISSEEKIHHIDGDKTNNKIENLFLCDSEKTHQKTHRQMDKISFDLVKSGIILFDKSSGCYYKNPLIDIKTMDISLGFEDVAIKQKKNICRSRLDVDISSEIIRGITRPIPMIAANMSTVCNFDFCIKLYNLGALGILHRADTEENIIKSVKEIYKKCDIIAASIGIGDDQFVLAKNLIKAGANIITIDIAQGFSDAVIDLGKKIKSYSPETRLIIGNVVNSDFIYEVSDIADAIKVGIAQGFACDTKNTAGCTEKQFSAVYKFKHLSKIFDIPIIGDGGIREPADFVKSIAAGANSIMAGKIFAECPESAAEVDQNGKKIYAGMASKYVQKKWKERKSGTCYEGGTRLLNIGDPVSDLLERYSGALRSGITYGGGNSIKTFQDHVEFIRI